MIDDPDMIYRAILCREPLLVCEQLTPGGIVIEDWHCFLTFWLEGVQRVICSTPDLADRLRIKLESESCDPMPLIRFLEVRHAA